MSSRPLPQYTIAQLLARAAELDAMAATASTQAVKEALERLAARFRAAAEQRAANERQLSSG